MQIKRFEFNMFSENTYVVWDEGTKECAIIDAGCFWQEEQKLLSDFISGHELKVTHLLNTHLHLDHVFGNAFVAREYGIKPEAGKEDEFLLQTLEIQCRIFGFTQNEPTVNIGKYLKEGEQVKVGSIVFDILHVPGHSPGSLAFYSAEHACVFVGDVLFDHSIGRTDLEGGDFGQLQDSIIRKLFILPDDTVVYSGHGIPTKIGIEKRENPYL